MLGFFYFYQVFIVNAGKFHIELDFHAFYVYL